MHQVLRIYQNSVLLITEGTGLLGNAVLRRFLNNDIKEIRIFSRDEKNKMICGKNNFTNYYHNNIYP
jgi:UDP-glucose 4-epimerase